MSKNSQWSHVPTPPTTNKLDELICDEHGGAIAWAYKKGHARLIAQAPRLLEALEDVLKTPRGTSGRIILEAEDEAEIRAAIDATKGNHNG